MTKQQHIDDLQAVIQAAKDNLAAAWDALNKDTPDLMEAALSVGAALGNLEVVQ